MPLQSELEVQNLENCGNFSLQWHVVRSFEIWFAVSAWVLWHGYPYSRYVSM